MPRLFTTNADLTVGHPYETLYAKYGVCCHHDNRPAYIRLQIECKSSKHSIHQVVHVVQCHTNQRSPIMVMRDCALLLKVVSKLDYPPSDNMVIEICDLNTFLGITRQRKLVNRIEHSHYRRFRSIVNKLPFTVIVELGEFSYSQELTEYIESLIDKNKTLTPTFERLGFANNKLFLRVEDTRKRLNLWM
jgi:hypothetical protein